MRNGITRLRTETARDRYFARISTLGSGGVMNEIETIDDLIQAKVLTTEEQKNLGDIIEECRVRRRG
jgi:hypothetical protein